MDIFQNQCSESLGFDSMLSSNHLHSPLHDSPCSPTNPYAPSSPYFSSISQQPAGHTSGPNDVILPSIFVKIPTQINQQYQQQESRLLRSTHHSTASEIKCEERSDSIKSEIADTRVRLAGNGLASVDPRLPDVIDNYLNDTDRVEPAEVEPNVRTCDRCPFATLSEVRLSEHRRERHPGGGVGVGPQESQAEKLSCPVCENKFYKKAVLELHLTEDHEMLASEVAALGQSSVTTLQSERGTAPQVRIEPAIQQNCVEIPPGPPAATPTATSTATHSKSRIYIKDVQLLKKPDVIAQESHDAQGQQLLSTEQEPSAIAHGTLQDGHQLSLGEDMLPSLDQSLQLPPQQQPCAVSGNKIFIRNVSLLQNVNFVASAENMLTNGNGNRYGTAPPPSPQPPPPSSYLSMDCANDGSGALLDTINGGYGGTIAAQPAPSAVAQSSRGSRIYIKNVDILRNHPLIALDDPGVPCTNSLSTTTFSESIATSRASSCESIICTSTPPATATEQQQPPTVPVPSSMTNNSLGAVSQANDQPLLHGTEISYATVGGDAMGNPARPLPLAVDQGSQNLLMLFSTSLDGTPGGGSVGEPNVSYLTASSNMTVQQGGEYGTLPQPPPPPPPAQCDVQQQTTGDVPQQQPRKSKIFIKNISVLKQPTIHLKSVDEVNLMTYDELQNILPTVGGMSSQVGMDGGGDTIGGPLEQHEAHEQHTLDGANRLDKPFGGMIEMNAHHSPELVEHGNVEQHGDGDDDDVMDGYHESDLGYGELSDVCDFTEGFNDRDDPGGGGGGGGGGAAGVGGIDMTACTANDDTTRNGHLVTESTHCEPTLPPGSGFTGDIILLQEESDASEKITPNHEWAAIVEPANGPPLGQDILQQPMEMSDGNEANPLRREEDLLLGNSHPHVINLDPPNEYHPPVGDSDAIVLAAAVNPSIGETQQPMDALTPSQEEANVSGVTALAEPDRPRTRGRPKGAKQTGITKLKKLYTNLTVEEEGYKCDLKDCGVRFRQPDRLDYHRKCHLVAPDSPNPIHCPECGSLEFRNWNTLHTHLWREHAIDMELYACHLCSFKTPVLCRLNNTHMKIHSEERNFKCAICGKAFKNNKQLRNHRRWHREPQQQQQQPQHQEAPVVEEQQPVSQLPPVEEPPAIGPTQSNDASQGDKPKAKPTSIQQSTMKCVKCGLRFAGKRQLRTHMDAKHPTEAGEPGSTGEVSAAKHRCLLCGMVFRTRYLLQSHAAKHSDEKRFKCEHCEYTTNDHNAFRRHKMRHSTKGGHMYKCSYCDYSSIQSTTYRKHLERMHAEVASALLYKCAKCPFVSISEAKYQLHRTKHQEEGGEARGRSVALGVEPVQENDPEQQQRQCESVNSDVVIVEQQQQLDAVADGLSSSPMDVELLGGDAAGGGLQIIQHPIIRPAMFANNFSKVDNFYGYQPAQQHGQPFAPSPRGMCPSPQVSCAVGLMPTPTTTIPVPVSGQLVTEQHEYVHLANAVTGDVLMRELN